MSGDTGGSGNTVSAARITDNLFRVNLDRGEGRRLSLFSRAMRDYRVFDGLPSVPPAGAHLRQHPLTGEWMSYSGVRQGRTFLPNASDCPLCPMTSPDALTDVPVDDYDVAIFTNRFAALTPEPGQRAVAAAARDRGPADARRHRCLRGDLLQCGASGKPVDHRRDADRPFD